MSGAKKIPGQTHPFRHPAFWGRRIIVTAGGQFIESHSKRALGRVAKNKDGWWEWKRAAGWKSSGPDPRKFLHSDWLPLMRRLNADVKPQAVAA